MITAGIDCGNKNIKAVILKDGEVIGKRIILSGFDLKTAAQTAFNEALASAGIAQEEVEHVAATGAGRHEVAFADSKIAEVSAAVRGGRKLCPTAHIVLDVGAEEGRAIKIDAQGKVIDFVQNDKCAAGTGSFVESMARTLQVTIEDMGLLSLKGTKEVLLNAQCVVFAESEVISLIHTNHALADIVRAVHNGIAGKVASMVRKVGLMPDCLLAGGLALNPGFAQCLKEELQVEIVIPEEPMYVSALGAAIYAADDNK